MGLGDDRQQIRGGESAASRARVKEVEENGCELRVPVLYLKLYVGSNSHGSRSHAVGRGRGLRRTTSLRFPDRTRTNPCGYLRKQEGWCILYAYRTRLPRY